MTGFKATGHGYQNQNGGLAASESTASGMLIDSKGQNRLYLYVSSVSNQWSLTGSASQTHSRRQFYPQHLVQDMVVIKGQCPSQYEYDRLVEFVETHHRSSLGLVDTDPNGNMNSGIFSSAFDKSHSNDGVNPDGSGIGITFMLMPRDTDESWNQPVENGRVTLAGSGEDRRFDFDRSSDWSKSHLRKGIYKMPPMHVSGLITEIRAGAKRFVQTPEFEIGLKVLYDYKQSRYEDIRDVQRALGWYVSGLGTFYTEQKGEKDEFKDDTWDSIKDAVDGLVGAGESIVDGVIDIVGGSLNVIGNGESGSASDDFFAGLNGGGL